LVARITATYGTHNGSDLLAVATTHLVSQQATHHRTDGRTGDLMLILNRALTGHSHVLTHLARRADGFLDRLHGQHFGILGTAHQAIGSHGTAGGHTNRTQHSPYDHRLVHGFLQKL